MRLKSVDYIYVLLSSVSGIWQAWCLNYPSNSLLLAILWSLPFALASYAHASLLKKAGIVNEPPDWKRVLVLWAGMQLSLVIFSLTGLLETQIMRAFYPGADNFPFLHLRIFIAEGAGCLAWAACLLVWSRQPGRRLSMRLLPALFATLFAGVLFAYGLSYLIRRNFHKDLLMLVTSIVVTMISALILVFLSSKAHDAKRAQVTLSM